MQDFERFTGVNLGGEREYQFAPMDDIENIPSILNGSYANELTFAAEKRFYSAYSTPETIKVSEKSKQKTAGTLFQLRVEGFYPKQTPEALANLMQMQGRRFAVLVTNNNGDRKLFLNLRFAFTPVSQKSVKKRAGYTLNFYLDAPKPAYFYPF